MFRAAISEFLSVATPVKVKLKKFKLGIETTASDGHISAIYRSQLYLTFNIMFNTQQLHSAYLNDRYFQFSIRDFRQNFLIMDLV